MLLMRSFSIAAMVAAMLASHPGHAQSTYTLKVLAVPGASQTYAVGISSAGLIAGTYYTDQSNSYTYDTSLQNPTYKAFTAPPAHGGTVLETDIAAISLHGDIAGSYTEKVGTASTTYGFLYSSGTYTTFEFPGSVQTQVTAVSSQGTVVAGTYFIPSTPGFGHAFVYRPVAKMHYKEITGGGLGDYYGLQPQTVNNSGFVTGTYNSVDRNQNRSFITAGSAAVDFNPKVSGVAACLINGANPAANVLVGLCYSPVQGMVFTGGAAKLENAPGATSTFFGAISVNDVVAGIGSDGTNSAIFSTDGKTFKVVQAPSTWTGISTVGINIAGKIVGRFTDAKNITKVFLAH